MRPFSFRKHLRLFGMSLFSSRKSRRRFGAMPAQAQALETRLFLSGAITALAEFENTNGSAPFSPLLLHAGNLYGTASFGGDLTQNGGTGDGTIFDIPLGTTSLTTVATFEGTTNLDPDGNIVFDSSGNLFGATFGTIFELPAGSSSIVQIATVSGTATDGLTIDSFGNLYGATQFGGANSEGSIFELPVGTSSVITLASFNKANGYEPNYPPLVDAAGNLYGVTGDGGDLTMDEGNGVGTVWEILAGSGSITTLANFENSNGAVPEDSLIMDSAGDLLGTAEQGGDLTQNGGNGDGTIFEIFAGSSSITTLATFDGSNGSFPEGALLLDDGNLYGTATAGGDTGVGNIFELAAGTSSIILLASFNLTNGSGPNGDLIADSSGNLYGTTFEGGDLTMNDGEGDGTVFEYSVSTTPPPATTSQLVFATAPGTVNTGATLSPAVTVDVDDASGAVVTTDSSLVTLAIASGPAGATLGGTVSEAAVNGVATFSNLSLSEPGTYTLTATDAALTPATTADISVITPASIGSLDPSFGVGGLVAHSIGLTSTAGVVVQSNGQTVIAGTAGSSPDQDIAVTRYNTDGSLDTSFGTGGVTDTPLPGNAQAVAETLLPDGDILVAGINTTLVNGQSAGSQFALVEFTPTGALDTLFGNGAGYVLTSFSATPGTLTNDVPTAMAVGPDGTIYVGGSSDANGSTTDFAIAAYTSSGNPSPTFGTNGHVLLGFLGGNNAIGALTIGPKDDLIAAGSAVNPSTGVSAVALAEFLPDGALNPKFGVKGDLTTAVGSVDDGATAVTLDPKGNIVVGGFTGTGSAASGTLSANFLLLRYTSTGKLDRTFGSGGIVTTSFNQPAAVSNILISAGGAILASGKTAASLTNLNPTMLEVAVARYTAKGQLDTTFNGTGQLIVSLSSAVPDSLTSPDSLFSPLDQTSDLLTAFMQLTQSDQGVIATTSGGDLIDVGNSGANTVEAAIVSMGVDLAADLLTSLPPSVVGGAKSTASVSIREVGTQLAAGTFTVELFASSGPGVSAGQAPFQSYTEKLKLKEGAALNLHLKFAYPSSLTKGDYYLVATVNTGTTRDLNPANNTSASGSAVLIAPAFVLLAGSGLTAPVFFGHKPATVSFTIMNAGNVLASAHSAVEFLASTDGLLSDAMSLATVPLPVLLKSGTSRTFRVKLALPATVAEGTTYFLLALLDPANLFHDPNAATNFIVSGNTFTLT